MDDSEQQHCFEFEDSRLGTMEYWDNFYDTELANFEDMGDEGEIWFGRTTELRMLKYIIERVPLSASICDLGCGNGSLLRKLRARGYTNLCGFDYSVNAVELAKRASSPSRLIEQQKIVRNSVPDITTNDIMMQRIDYQIADLTAQKLGNELHGRFHVLLDKGTLDAISLNSDRKRHLRNYHENICKMFTAHMDGDDCEVLLGTKETAVVPLVRRKCKQILIVVSCNFTKDELIDLLETDEHLQFECELPNTVGAGSIQFGGKVGYKCTGVVFKWCANEDGLSQV